MEKLPEIDRSIMQTFAPTLRINPSEVHKPYSLNGVLKNWSLYSKPKGSSKVKKLKAPQLEAKDFQFTDLDYEKNDYWVSLEKRKWPIGESGKDYPTGNTLKGDGKQVYDPMYAKMFDHRKKHGVVEIVYAFFFEMNGFTTFRCKRVPDSIFEQSKIRNFQWGRFGRHEGDWEHVTVRLAYKKGKYSLMGVFCGQHSESKWYPYHKDEKKSKLKVKNGHPLLYVALGTHAIYNEDRVHTVEELGKAASALIFQDGFLWLNIIDYTGPDRKELKTYQKPPSKLKLIHWEPRDVVDVIYKPEIMQILKFKGHFGKLLVDNRKVDNPADPKDYSGDKLVKYAEVIAPFVPDKFKGSGPKSPEWQGGGWWQEKDHKSNPLPNL